MNSLKESAQHIRELKLMFIGCMIVFFVTNATTLLFYFWK